MFRLHSKGKSQKSGERFEFKFFNFHALQVPKGWDKLYVLIVSVETGRTVTKSGRASVRNGSCQWTETLSESITISQPDAAKQDDCLFKLVVSMGSTRSGILGEATVKLASYRNSKTAVPVSLPLRKCNHGTILQLKIQCLTPKAEVREEQLEEIGSFTEDLNIDSDDIESKSDVSDSSLTKSVGSSSSNHFDTAHAGELLNRDFNLSATSSRYSFDSMDGSLGRETYSPRNNGSTNNQIGRQDSTGSQNSFYGSYSLNDFWRSNHSSFNSKMSVRSGLQIPRDDSNQVSKSVASSPLRNTGSSKDLLEAAESKSEDLRAEARMWEQNARKLMNDQEKLQKELLDQSKHQASLEMELSESQRECSDLKLEIEQVKILLEESTAKQRSTENMEFQSKEMESLQKELEDEVRFEKESNTNLALQLNKTQESNLELVSILQELEDTIEKQKMEIAILSEIQSKNEKLEECGDDFENIRTGEVLVNNTSKLSSVRDLEGSTSLDRESDKDMELEVRQLQESKKNLESTIQSLQKSLQEKFHELEAAQVLKTRALRDCEAQWQDKLAEKEKEVINLKTKLSEALKVNDFDNGGDSDLIREVEDLKQKIVELEKDCNELTDENLELALKLKESERNTPMPSASYNSLFVKHADDESHSEFEMSKMKYEIGQLKEELNRKEILIEQLSTDHLEIQCADLKKKCADLELRLQAFKDKTTDLDDELRKYHARAEEQGIEITALQQQLEYYQAKETETKDDIADNFADIESSQSDDAVEMSKTLSELHEQIQSCLVNLKKQQLDFSVPANSECYYALNDTQNLIATDSFGIKEQAEAILNNFIQLKQLFEAKVTAYNGELKQIEEGGATTAHDNEVHEEFEDCENTFSTSTLGQENLHMKSKPESTVSDIHILEKTSEIDRLISDNLLKEKEVEALRCSQRESESQISDLQNEKRQLEENMEAVMKNGTILSTCLDASLNGTSLLNGSTMMSTGLDASENETLLRTTSMDPHVSADEISDSKSELESSKSEVELHLSELEKENVWLSERICGLEAQLRYLTDEREQSRLELQNSELLTTDLQKEIRRFQNRLEAEKDDRKQKMQEMQNRWLESQAESEYLKIANLKLQTTTESLMDECSLLQKSIIDLRKQKMELHEHCRILEAELIESQKSLEGMIMKVEALDGKYILMLEEIASKERALCLELDMLFQDNSQYKKELIKEESLLNQMYLEKAVEVVSLHKEVAKLTEIMSASQDEKERTASEAVLEVSQFRADKAVLEASLKNVQGKLELSETNLSALQTESENKLSKLQNELIACKQNQEILMADHENLLELLEDVKSNEEKHKSVIRVLELKLKASACEKLQLEEEISSLKVQLQKTALLENEILELKKSLNEVQFENQRHELSLQMLSGDYEELKVEKVKFLETISDMQRIVSELEHCKRSKVSLEERVLRLEGDLTASEALGAQDAELKNELARLKRANNELNRKIRFLQEGKQESIKRSHSSKEELEDSEKSSGFSQHFSFEASPTSSSTAAGLKLSQVDDYAARTSQVKDIDILPRLQLLEVKLAEALEANDMYKAQLKSLLLEGSIDDSNALDNLRDEAVKELKNSASSLVIELKDLRERYFHLSIKCAEVETEREQLVLELRSFSNGRR